MNPQRKPHRPQRPQAIELGAKRCYILGKECEIEMLKGTGIRPSSRLRNLGPFIDNEGLIRVSGRLQRSALPENAKHPVILDPKDRLVSLMIDKAHKENGHVGAQHTLHKLRQEYWILHGLSAIKKRISSCVYCQRIRKPMMMQKMSTLPPQRLTPNEPPFTFTGLDFLVRFLQSWLEKSSSATAASSRVFAVEQFTWKWPTIFRLTHFYHVFRDLQLDEANPKK